MLYLLKSMTFKKLTIIYKQYLVFSSANYRTDETDLETGNWHPATLAIVGGKPFNLFVDPSIDGLVTIKDGKPQISNQKEMNEAQVISFVDSSIDNGNTVFQSSLLVFKGKNLVPANASRPSLDNRRVLATFQDGSYGIIQINKHLKLDELSDFLSKIPGIENAVNLDTGGGNLGGFADKNGHYQLFNDTADYEQAALFYIK